MKRMLVITVVAVCLALPLGAQTDSPLACESPEYRQFDFWLGKWEVTANEKVAGTNHIRAILGGCVLMEEWQSSSGTFAGKSFNRYDRETGRWEQTWVDNQGGVLKLTGEFKDGKMVLAGDHVAGGEPVIDRITWTPNDDGTVRQLWEKSKDGGATWSVAFDGLYRKVK